MTSKPSTSTASQGASNSSGVSQDPPKTEKLSSAENKAKKAFEGNVNPNADSLSLSSTSNKVAFKPIKSTENLFDRWDMTVKVPKTPKILEKAAKTGATLEEKFEKPVNLSFSPKKFSFGGIVNAAGRSLRWGSSGVGLLGVTIFSKVGASIESKYPGLNKGFAQISEEEEKTIKAKVNTAWLEYKTEKNLDIKNVVSLRKRTPLKTDGTPDLDRKVRFEVTVVKRNDNGNPIPTTSKKNSEEIGKYKKFKEFKGQGLFETETIVLFEGENYDSIESIYAVATAINWLMIGDEKRKTYSTLKEYQIAKKINFIEETIEAEKNSLNNCWLHIAIQRALNNKSIMNALAECKFDKKLINPNDKNPKSLIECIKKCVNKSPEKQKEIIEKAAKNIRDDLKLETNTQEDLNDAYNVLESYLKKTGGISPLEITHTLTYNKLDENDMATDEIFNKTDTEDSIKLYKSDATDEIDVSEKITAYLTGEKEKGNIITSDDKSKKWIVTEATITLPEAPPPSITIENVNKTPLKIDTIPFNLKFDSQKIEIDPSGNFEFNYATIHEGDDKGGHYYAIYKENNQWYMKDNTQAESLIKIDLVQVKERLKNATTLVYEDKSIVLKKETPIHKISKWAKSATNIIHFGKTKNLSEEKAIDDQSKSTIKKTCNWVKDHLEALWKAPKESEEVDPDNNNTTKDPIEPLSDNDNSIPVAKETIADNVESIQVDPKTTQTEDEKETTLNKVYNMGKYWLLDLWFE